MNWTNVKLIFFREVRDQLRDRRTLFMIAVLPLVLYPLLGMSMFQVSQFVREQPTRVLIVGHEALPDNPRLIDGDHFASAWVTDPHASSLLQLVLSDETYPPGAGALASAQAEARRWVEAGKYEAIIWVPADFGERLTAFREHLRRSVAEGKTNESSINDPTIPSPVVFYSTAKEKSALAYLRVEQVLDRWSQAIAGQNLATTRTPPSAVKPFVVADHDVAGIRQRQAATWSKILPFMLLIWALTGAFYPAIDLCAGEKERGTLETLLSSPAERGEIVWGKLLTVMAFSMATAILNLFSLGITGAIVVSHFPDVGFPPPLAPVWLLLALVPMAALFSSLCLALAALARSTKEGQYYLMPLLLIIMPLMILPMAPGVELSLGNSLIPVTGVVLLLRNMLEGNYWQAIPFMAPVVCVTLACCLLAVRWAGEQFNSEAVLFREGERLDVGLWLRRLMRDREDTPSSTAAVFCGVLILMVNFFMSFAIGDMGAMANPVLLALVTQLVVIATPALLMTIMLTRSPRETLLMRLPPWGAVPMAALLAVCVHPVVNGINVIVQYLYPVSEPLQQALTQLVQNAPSKTHLILAVALAPAICEELAFRGFILSGFRHLGHKWRAIVFSSIFFGITHGIFQQSIVATIVGVVIGYLAVQSGSLFPGMVYHFVHNALALLSVELLGTTDTPTTNWLRSSGTDGFTFSIPAIAIGAIGAATILVWFSRLPYRASAEEALQQAIERPQASVA
ncbi:MAG TPA: ABC transporter permease subunit/CPBP intramembrane protease [Pirellulales bacterium]|nr:ABC transporter permease subunit/CPBP intramembrane protease [Pirellulales bacterium]